ncbi:hypothetical protein [Microbulbifer spongiae]|uniref:Uncharacterized protein n=1 Tax=Microbulbifer spongiae TaxID=2944933 RepID=A0ABY9EAL9_9GAMM|nr:hypothetical protein [Microbulbifer sp. MI-G]WKD50068.1 hypothetical protein M8T91_01170 [Microbulbifer sp. MI-G]
MENNCEAKNFINGEPHNLNPTLAHSFSEVAWRSISSEESRAKWPKRIETTQAEDETIFCNTQEIKPICHRVRIDKCEEIRKKTNSIYKIHKHPCHQREDDLAFRKDEKDITSGCAWLLGNEPGSTRFKKIGVFYDIS